MAALAKNLFILPPGRIPLVDTHSHQIFILPPRVHPPPLAPTYNFHVITQQKFSFSHLSLAVVIVFVIFLY